MVFRNRNFVLMFLSSFLSALGDTVYFLTLSWLITDLFHSGTLMGTVMLLVGTIRFLCGMLGGGIVDQVGPKRVMILSDALRAVVMAAMFAALLVGELQLWYLVTLAIIFGLIDSLYWPATSAMQQQVLQSFSELNRANSMMFTILRLLAIFGPALGGYLLLTAAYSTIMLLIGCFFILSALLTLWVKLDSNVPTSSTEPTESARSVFRKFGRNLREGYGFLLTNRLLMTLVVTIFFANIGANGAMVLFPFLVQDLGWQGEGLGILQMSVAAGSILLGFVLSARPFKTPSLYVPMVGFFGQGAMLVLVAFMSSLTGVSGSLFVQGMFTALIGVMIPTIMQTLVPNQMMGQVGGIMMTISMASTPFSQFLFGTLTDQFGPQRMFLIAGGIEVVIAVLAIVFLKKSSTPYSLPVGHEGVSS